MGITKILSATAMTTVILAAGCGVASGSLESTAASSSLQGTTMLDAGAGDAAMIDQTPFADSNAPDAAADSNAASRSSAVDEDSTSAMPPELAEAIEAASNYLSLMPFSEKGLVEQLSSDMGDGYPYDVAAAAVAGLNVDWNKQAVKAAANYLSLMSFSKQGLIEQLESDGGDGYTHEQAVYGADHAYEASTENGNASQDGGRSAELDNAIAAAQNYLSTMPFSEKGLIEQLSASAGDGYSSDAASAAVASLDVDWNEQAAKSAANYLDLMSFSKQELVDQLISGDGYTRAQAEYGAGKSYR